VVVLRLLEGLLDEVELRLFAPHHRRDVARAGDGSLLAWAEEREHRGDRLGVFRIFADRLVPGDRGGDRPERPLSELEDVPPLLVRVLTGDVEDAAAEEDGLPAEARRVLADAHVLLAKRHRRLLPIRE